tara:strand:- start:238 stop:537 length:300 start_codon:yes stop_codon:yes gene_type:complete
MIKNLKKFLKVKDNLQLTIIMIVFAITGSLTLFLSDYLLIILNITKESMNIYIFWFLRILIIFPVYQILLIIIGTLFGQFNYFWSFEKKFLRRIGIKFN